jgi:hypothetical protein
MTCWRVRNCAIGALERCTEAASAEAHRAINRPMVKQSASQMIMWFGRPWPQTVAASRSVKLAGSWAHDHRDRHERGEASKRRRRHHGDNVTGRKAGDSLVLGTFKVLPIVRGHERDRQSHLMGGKGRS